MPNIKQLCMGVCVAGAVAGGGSALATAVAQADTGATDSANSAGPSAVSRATRAEGAPAARRPASAAAIDQRRSAAPARAAERRPAASVAKPTASQRASALTLAPSRSAPESAAASALVSTKPRSVAALPPAQESSPATPPHVVVVGIDGVRLDTALSDPTNTNFLRVMNQGITGPTNLIGHTTLSGPAWTTVLTGVWDTKSGVINNIFNARTYDRWPSVYNLIEAHNPAITTAVVAGWSFLTDMAASGAVPADYIDFVQVPGDANGSLTDAKVAANTVDLIGKADPSASTCIFTYLEQVDMVGHQSGGASQEYRDAISRSDTNLGIILDAVEARELETGEDWTVLVVSDHGMTKNVPAVPLLDMYLGHGFQSPAETQAWVIADFAGDSSNDGNLSLGYSIADVTPTILELFDVPMRSDFDGVPIQSTQRVLDSIVVPVNLRQSVNDAIGVLGYPDIPTNLALSTRTVFASVPYFLGKIVESVTASLQSIVDQDIFLISPLVAVAEAVIGFSGNVLVDVTQAVAQVVGFLTGAGTIAPTDPPLSPPSTAVPYPALLSV